MKRIIFLLLIAGFIMAGCSDEKSGYKMTFKGGNGLFTMDDKIEGNYLSGESAGNETHSFILKWTGEEMPSVITAHFRYYETEDESKLYLDSIGESNYEKPTKMEAEISGIDVINVDFDSYDIPDDIDSLFVDVKYEYATSGEKAEETIELMKQ